MTDFKITIPAPCPKDWDEMSPANGGRHCCHCDKVVVDFTAMSSVEIKNYFIGIKNEHVCGHFKAEQVSNSGSGYLQKVLSQWHKHIEEKLTVRFLKSASLFILSICTILTGCRLHTKGEIKTVKSCNDPKDSSKIKSQYDSRIIMGKAIRDPHMVNGEPYFPPADTLKNTK